MRIWGNQTHDGLRSHNCCSCVDHVLMLTLRWAGPTHPQGPAKSLVCIFQNKKLKSSNLSQLCCVSVWLQEISPANGMLHLIMTASTSLWAGLATIAWKALAKPQVIPCCRWGLAVLWQPPGSLIPQNAWDLKFYLRCSLLNVLSYSHISAMIRQATVQSYCDMNLYNGMLLHKVPDQRNNNKKETLKFYLGIWPASSITIIFSWLLGWSPMVPLATELSSSLPVSQLTPGCFPCHLVHSFTLSRFVSL